MNSVTVKVHVANGRKGQKRLEIGAKPPPPPERVARVARLLALAHRWNDLIRSGSVRDRAELSRLIGVSRARVSQVMRLLDLAPDIQEAVLDGKVDGPGVELALRKLAEEAEWAGQRAMLQAESRTVAGSGSPTSRGMGKRDAPPRGPCRRPAGTGTGAAVVNTGGEARGRRDPAAPSCLSAAVPVK